MNISQWVNSLSPSAAQFWGAIIGVGGGLAAILAGALFISYLNRRRDDRLRTAEGRAVAAAIRGELASIRLSIVNLLPIWKDGRKMYAEKARSLSTLPGGIGASVDASDYAKLPPSHATIFEANAARLGLLGSHLAGAVAVVYTNYQVRSEIFRQSFNMRPEDLPEHFFQQIAWGANFCKSCEEVESLLIEYEKTGTSPLLDADKQQLKQHKQKAAD